MPEMKATLWNWTPNPIETIYCEWLQSRSEGPVPSPKEVHERIVEEQVKSEQYAGNPYPGPFEREVRQRFEEGLAMKVPMAETIQFLWLFENVSVSWREQAVRHQIGHKFGGAAGFDQIPGLPDSSFWVQSMRQKDMGKFADKGEYYVPETVLGNNKVLDLGGFPSSNTVSSLYTMHMWHSQDVYNQLVKEGVPLEDARNVLPMACTHRLVWSMNWASMTALLSKRSCWIAQLGMWEPVITQMLQELRTKVDPYFARLGDPPCIGKDDKYHSCPFELENKEYIRGNDPHHPCPLWTRNQVDVFARTAREERNNGVVPVWEPMAVGVKCNRPMIKKTVEEEVADRDRRIERYAVLWGRHPHTGERVKLS